MASFQADPASVPSAVHNDASPSNLPTQEGRCNVVRVDSLHVSYEACHERCDCPGYFHKSLCKYSPGSSNPQGLSNGGDPDSTSKPGSLLGPPSGPSSGFFGTDRSFGSAPATSKSSGGLFGTSQSSGGLFGTSKPSGGLFGTSSSFGGAPATSHLSGGLFGTFSSLKGDDSDFTSKPRPSLFPSGGLFGTPSSLPGFKVDELNTKVDNLRSKVDNLRFSVDNCFCKVDSLSCRVDNGNRKVDALGRKVDELSHKVDALAENIAKALRLAGV
ncbi:unnamed protein product [Clonostachys rosea]|uniref:Uncharacterized protein n=1 Tax=Bionectria ochroleuca TaxID=29856 RepID=A0ABY6ULZ6_BIOOC|nr:unnamed protein product [Clonostachys rosea]